MHKIRVYVDTSVFGGTQDEEFATTSKRGRWSMATKTKAFDCVEMKRGCQRKLREEYEARKDEFGSYRDFLEAKANESPWVQRMRRRFRERR